MKLTIELDTATAADLEALQRMFARNVTHPRDITHMVIEGGPIAEAVGNHEVLRPGGINVETMRAKPPAPKPTPKAPKKLVVKPAPKLSKASKAVKADGEKLAARGKEMTKAAKDLSDAAGAAKPKLTPKQKAKLAAKARWAKRDAVVAAQNAVEDRGPKQAKTPTVKQATQPRAPKPPTKPKPPAKKAPPPRPEPKPQDFSKAEEEQITDYPEVAGGEMETPNFPDGKELLEGTFKTPPQPEEEKSHEQLIEQIAREHDALPADVVAG